MYGSAIPRVTSKHPGPQPPPEISHCDCAGVNCTQKKAWRPLDGDLESSALFRLEGAWGESPNGESTRAHMQDKGHRDLGTAGEYMPSVRSPGSFFRLALRRKKGT